MTRAIGYVAADVNDMAPALVVEMLARLGYSAVDWTMEQFDPLVDSGQHLEALVLLAAEHGLGVPQLMVHQDYVTADAGLWDERVRRSELAIDAAAAANVPTVGVVTGPNRWVSGWRCVGVDLPEEDAWAMVVQALERLLARARGTGVRVALEPCWGTIAWYPDAVDRLLEQLGPELALNFDPSHFVMIREDAGELVRRWGARIAHVHLKDAFGVPGTPDEEFCFLLPGEGRTDWSHLLLSLDAIGYRGAMSVEFESFSLREHALAGDVEAGASLALQLTRGVMGRQEVS